MLKIRLMRLGAKKRPFYRVVVVDERKKRTGGYLDLIGTYNPLTQPKEINLDQKKIEDWTKKGAQMSVGFLRIIGKAKPRLARKPKKAQPEKAPETQATTDTSNTTQPLATEVVESPTAAEDQAAQIESQPAAPATSETAETPAEPTNEAAVEVEQK